MPDGMADGQSMGAFAIEQDREYIIGHNFLDDGGDCRELFRQIQSLRSDARHFQQEIQQLSPLPETWSRPAGRRRGGHDPLRAASSTPSMISTPELVPMR